MPCPASTIRRLSDAALSGGVAVYQRFWPCDGHLSEYTDLRALPVHWDTVQDWRERRRLRGRARRRPEGRRQADGQVHPGGGNAPLRRGPRISCAARARERCHDSSGSAAARACDVVLTLAEAAGIVREIGSPAIRTMFDTHNAVDEVEPHAALVEKYFDLIRHVHVNEMDGGHPGTDTYDFR